MAVVCESTYGFTCLQALAMSPPDQRRYDDAKQPGCGSCKRAQGWSMSPPSLQLEFADRLPRRERVWAGNRGELYSPEDVTRLRVQGH